MKTSLSFVKKTLLPTVLFVCGGFAANAAGGQISFTGSVVDPGCELQLEGISCYQAEQGKFDYKAFHIDRARASLEVGESVSLPVLSSRIELIEVSRLTEEKTLISASVR